LVATLARFERVARMDRERGPIRAWRKMMSSITDSLDRKGMNSVDTVMAMNRRLLEHARADSTGSRLALVFPGVDTDRFHPPAPGRVDTGNYCISVGRFDDARKDVPTLFRAYARLAADVDEPPRLLMVGRTRPTERDWRLARHLGVAERISFRANASAEELPLLLRDARFFVLASAEEGLGIASLEAMASGLPVVATDTDGSREVVVDGITGFVSPPGEHGEIASNMRRLVEEPALRSRMAHAARQRAVDKFSVDSARSHLLREYDILLGSRQSRSETHGTADEAVV
jgi:glycosyltransferase involved in cell wall biosynthesis